ncbi:hypothetical protein D3C75_643040 [compost metagenome]
MEEVQLGDVLGVLLGIRPLRRSVLDLVMNPFDAPLQQILNLRVCQLVHITQNLFQLSLGLDAGFGEQELGREHPTGRNPGSVGAFDETDHIQLGFRIGLGQIGKTGLNVVQGTDISSRLAFINQIKGGFDAGEVLIDDPRFIEMLVLVQCLFVRLRQKSRNQLAVFHSPLVGAAVKHHIVVKAAYIGAGADAEGVLFAVFVRVLLGEGLQNLVQLVERGGRLQIQSVQPIFAVDDPVPGLGEGLVDAVNFTVDGAFGQLLGVDFAEIGIILEVRPDLPEHARAEGIDQAGLLIGPHQHIHHLGQIL